MNQFFSDSCLFISDLNPSNCASWVQAIGSILAIVAAIFVARHSAAQARQAYTHARVERLGEQVGPVIALLGAAVSERERIWSELADVTVEGGWVLPDDMLGRLNSVRVALEQVPVHTMPSVNAATYLLDAKVIVKELESVGQELVAQANMVSVISQEDRNHFEAVGDQIDAKRAAFRQELVRLTTPVDGGASWWLRFLPWLAKP